jgi:hypothetical protein
VPPSDSLSEVFLDYLTDLDFEPVYRPSGEIGTLRGGRCFDLKTGGNIDTVMVLSKTGLGGASTNRKRVEFRIEYAIRGTVKGFLSNRILALIVPLFEGLIRRRFTGFQWEIPLHKNGATPRFSLKRVRGRPLGPGEIWDGGPHHALLERLRVDEELTKEISEILKAYREFPQALCIVTDRWGESLRISSGVWLSEVDLPRLYFNLSYLKIIQCICSHLRSVRREFGGLTF